MKQPKIIAILNLTPDSFSDGGRNFAYHNAVDCVKEMIEIGVDIIDIGAESTRPGASAISAQDEIDRIEKSIYEIKNLVDGRKIEISLDSRNFETMKYFINCIDIINDVTGFGDERMQDLALANNKKAIFMHSLSIPVKRGEYIDESLDIIEYLQRWFDNKLVTFKNKGFDASNLIFDPGIGFGLSPAQSLQIIRRVDEFKLNGVKIMIGHSRKSFLSQFGEVNALRRDPDTHAITQYLSTKKVDYIRVHDFKTTKRIYGILAALA